MAVPMVLAQLVNVTYSIVDRIFVGHIENVGSLALTGIGLTLPIVSLIVAFACLFGNGGGAFCSIVRGEGDRDKAEKIMGNSFAMLVLTGLFLTVVLEISAVRILYALGASENTIDYASSYARIYILGTIPVMISLGMNFFINLQGFAKTGMLTVIIGAVINVILDPVFIFVLKLGVRGAALATVIAQICSAIWVLRFIFSKKAVLEMKPVNMKIEKNILKRILGLGLTNFVMNITACIVQMTSNLQLSRFGGDLYVSAMTIINSVREVLITAVQGVTLGSQPVLGFNYGAGQYARVKKGIRFVTHITLAYAVVIWTLIFVAPDKITMLFNDNRELIDITVPAMRIYFSCFMLLMFQLVGQNVFVGLGKSKKAIFFSALRKVCIVFPLVLVLPGFIGTDGVFLAEPISSAVGGLACYLTMYFTIYRKLDSGTA